MNCLKGKCRQDCTQTSFKTNGIFLAVTVANDSDIRIGIKTRHRTVATVTIISIVTMLIIRLKMKV